MSIAAGLFGLWWLAAVALLLGTTALAAWGRGGIRGDATIAPVSILIPLRHASEALAGPNAALAGLDPASHEVLFSVRKDRGAAAAHLPQAARIIATAPRPGWNPKLANLVEPIEAAAHDLILVKDTATDLPPAALSAMIGALGTTVGVVSAVPIARAPEGLTATMEAALINTYGARMLLALSVLGGGAGIGAAMLFRRSALQAAGGLETIHAAIADDHALAKLLARHRQRSVLAGAVSQQLGVRTAPATWQRHLRWAICRRLEEPLIFAAEPFAGAVAAVLAALGLASAAEFSPAPLIAGTLLLWPLAESLLALRRGWPMSALTPLAVVLRELAMPALWLQALAARRVVWGSASIPVAAVRRP